MANSADGSVTIEATLSTKQVEDGLKTIKNDLNKLSLSSVGDTLKKIGSTVTSVGNSIASVGKKITLGIAGVVAGVSTAIGRFDTLKNYPKVLKNLGISAEDAEQSIKDLSDGIDGLPTALDDASTGVQRLVAKNGDIKKSTKYFLAMNNAIIAGNAPMEQQKSALEQLTQAYSKGKFDMMEWRTLMMAMPGQLKQVSKAMGYVNTDDLYEALKQGTVSMEEFMDAIVELNEKGGDGIVSFQEQAKNSTDSIGTAITNVGNRFKKGFASILQGLDDMAKNTKFGSIAGMINEFSSSIKTFLDKVGESLKNSKSAQNFIEGLEKALTKLKDTVDNLSPEQIDKLVNGFITLAKVGPALLLIGKALSGVGKLISLGGSVANGISTVSGAVKIFGGTATTGTAGAKALASAMTALTGPVGIVLAVITGVITALVILYKKSETFRNAVNSAFESIKKALEEAWNTLKPALEELWGALQELFEALKPIGDLLLNVLVVAVKLLAEALKFIIPIITEIIKIVVQVLTVIIKTLTDVVNAIVKFFRETIPNAFNNFVEGVKNFVNKVIDFFSDLPTNLGRIVGYMIGELAKFGANAWNFVTQEIPKIINNIIDWFKRLPGEIWNWLYQSLVNLGRWAIEMINNGRQGASDMVNGVLDILRNLPDRIWEIGQNIVEGLWNGIQSAWGWIVSKVQDFASGILEGMKASLGIHSPSRVFKDQVGKNIALGIGEGFEDNIAKVYRDMKSAVDFETQRLSANLSTSANYSKVLTANINVNGAVEMDGNRVGRLVAPAVSRTLRTAGA